MISLIINNLKFYTAVEEGPVQLSYKGGGDGGTPIYMLCHLLGGGGSYPFM